MPYHPSFRVGARAMFEVAHARPTGRLRV
jgi:hypothetical protein